MNDSLPTETPHPAEQPAEKASATQALLKRLSARGLTQSEICRRTDIPQPRLSRWMNGEVAQGADDALKLKQLEDGLIEADQAAETK
jgi:transcriptional regulator with XRE-family HTH domain